MANDILVKIGADISDFSRKMAESSKALKDFGNANSETFDAFKKTGAAVTGAGVALAGGLGFAVKTAANFEEAMSNVKAISGAVGGEFDSLRDKAMEMGAKTAFSASESADAMANLAQMGWKTDDILAGIEHTLNLAAAGSLDLADAAMIAANTINQFGLEASDAERVADVMAATASSAGTNVEEMAHALQYAGANASAAGMDIEQTAAFIGVLGDAGITGSSAGTALNAMLRDLKKNAEDGALAVGEQTVALYDANGAMRPMPDVISEIIRATENMSDEQRDAALSTLFGEEALRGFSSIAGQGADAVSNLAKELYAAGGTAQNMAEIQMDNLNGALTELSSAFEGVQIALGSALIPIIRKATEWLTKLADWFNGLSENTKKSIAIFAAVASAIMLIAGPLLLLIGFIPQIIAGFTTLSTVFTAITGPVGIVIAAILAIVTTLVVVYNKVEWFRNLVNSAWEFIKGATVAAFNYVKGIISAVISDVVDIASKYLNKFKDLWSRHGDAIMTIVGVYINNVKNTINLVMGVIKGIFEVVWPIITNVVKVAWEFIKLVVSNALDIITGVIDFAMSVIQGDWSGAWNAIKGIAENIVGNILKFFKNVNLMQVGKDMIKGLIKGISSMAKAVVDSVKGVVDGAVKGAKKLLGIKSPSRVLMEIGKWTTMGLAEGIEDYAYLVDKASDLIAESAIPDVKNIDMSYATPDGVKSIMSAINGTVEVRGKHSQGITQNITIVSPDTTSPSENARQIKKAQRELAMEWGM